MSGSRLVLEISEPGDVRRVRRAVRELLARFDVVSSILDDIVLATSEVATNALLHGSPPVELVAEASSALLRVQIADRSPDRGVPQPASATASHGRGLAIVAALTQRWGVEPRDAGKAVWLEFPLDRDLASAGAPVRLLNVPIDVYLDGQEQIDGCLHEISFLALDGDERFADLEVRLVAPLREAMAVFADARSEGRAAAEATRSAGMTHVDLEWNLPDTAATAAEVWLRSIEELARMTDDALLFASPPSPAVRRFRRWLRDEVVHQLAGGWPRPFN